MKKITKTEMALLVDLGKRVAKARKAKKLTQEALAHILDIERAALGRIETGGINPTVVTLSRICEQLDIELKELF